MRFNQTPAVTEAQLRLLQDQAHKLAQLPTVEGCLDLAEKYRVVGLGKEAERLVNDAEKIERGELVENSQMAHLLSGPASAHMVVEVMQILSRTQLTGELLLENSSHIVRVYFQRGEVINATSSLHRPGFDSFCAATHFCHGTYCFVERSVPAERRLDNPLDVMLIEALQLQDEMAQILIR